MRLRSLVYINLEDQGWSSEAINEMAEDLKVTFGDTDFTMISLREVVAYLHKTGQTEDELLTLPIENMDEVFVNLEGR